MEPDEFVRRWNEYTTRTGNTENMRLVSPSSLDATISTSTRRFLTEAGLPDGGSWGFEFDLSKNLDRVSNVFGCYGKGGDWEPDVYERLNRYIYLGSDGGGNPICLDSQDHEKVVFVDHESFMNPALSGSFINSGIAHLAECILIFQEMLERYWQEEGEDAELYEGAVPARLIEKALSSIYEADPAVLTEGGYWPQLLKDI